MPYDDFDLSSFEMVSSGMDSFLGGSEGDAEIEGSSLPDKMRVASVGQLSGFVRVANDTLVRKSERDLWSLKRTEEGEWEIERLFDEDGNPLKV